MSSKKQLKKTEEWISTFFYRNDKIGLCRTCAYLKHAKNKPKCDAKENLKSFHKEKRLTHRESGYCQGKCSLWRPHYTFNEDSHGC